MIYLWFHFTEWEINKYSVLDKQKFFLFPLLISEGRSSKITKSAILLPLLVHPLFKIVSCHVHTNAGIKICIYLCHTKFYYFIIGVHNIFQLMIDSEQFSLLWSLGFYFSGKTSIFVISVMIHVLSLKNFLFYYFFFFFFFL